MGSAMWDARYAAAQVWDLEPSPIVVDAVGTLPRGRALDLGSGEGRHALWLASRGWRVTAVDHSAVAIGRLQERAAVLGLAVAAEVADVTQPLRRHGYDLVLAAYLQLPLASLKVALRAGAAALTSGGRMLVVAHDVSNVANGYGGPSDPDLTSSAAAVAEIMGGAGLEVGRAEVVTRQVTTGSGLRSAFDHVVHAVRPDAG